MSEFAELDSGIDDLAAAAMGQPQREYLAVRFYVQAQQNEQKTQNAGYPVFDDVDLIEIRIPGDPDVLRRPIEEADKKRFAAQYQAFKANQNQDAAGGTPLRELPGILASQVAQLSAAGVRTVELLANMPDTSMQRVGPFMALRQKARDWLAAAKDNAVLSKLRSENDDLRSRLTALENMLQTQAQEIQAARNAGGSLPAVSLPDPRMAALEAQIAALAAAVQQKPEPKKRGRPPKAAAGDHGSN